MSDRKPTDEQAHILDLARSTSDNIMINALAGCGKTSTLEMIERTVSIKPILYLVFNKKNAVEAEKRMLSTTTVRTFNSLGHRVWAGFCAKNLTLEPKKCQLILKEIINAAPKHAQRAIWDCYWEVLHGVAAAKSLGYIPQDVFPSAKRLLSQEDFHDSLDEIPDDLTSDLIDSVLTKSIKSAYDGYIDYNDQIYMPALFGGTFPRFPLVKVDEYQDLNPVNHAMLDKLVKGRIIGVGDPWQNIYGFRGAMRDGMGRAKQKFNMVEANLSVSFRCPKEIVKHVHWRVPHFKWIKDGGSVSAPPTLGFNGVQDGSTVICRNNAPLFRCAMALLSRGRGVSVAGSDIGPKLVGIMKKLGSDELKRPQLLSAIEGWREEKKSKSSKSADDMADCVKVFAEHGENLSQAVAYAEHLFKQAGTIRLTTGHKAKGLEWENVYHLDPWLCGEDDQDLNLRYVISTRSMNRLTEIDYLGLQWS